MKTLKLFVCKRYFALLCCLCINIFSAFAVYTLKLGEPLVLTVDCPVSTGWLTSTGWDCPQYVQTQPNGVGVCTVYPFYYYSGTVTVTCNYNYTYPDYYNGRYHNMYGSGTKYFSIKIVKPTFTIDKTEITVQPGERFVLCTSMSNVYTPKYTTVYWTTSDNSTVKEIGASGDRSYGNQNYEFTAVSLGTATITATIGSGTEVTCKVTVANPDPDRVSLSKTGKIKVGEHITLTPTLYPSDSKATYTWSSDKNSVATVSNDGVVTGKKTGTARITVTTHNGKTDYCDITVDKGDLTIKVDKESGLYAKGTNVLLSANFSDADIYYTLDGSTPTENSTRYTGPIALNENLTLKAIAMGSEYNPSTIVTRKYEVTSLKAIGYTPAYNTTTRNYEIEPSITFNEKIFKGQDFNNIALKCNEEVIECDYVIEDVVLMCKPKVKELPNGEYALIIPERSLMNELGEPNVSATGKFKINCPQLALEADVESGLLYYGTVVSLKCDVPSAQIYYADNESSLSDPNKRTEYTSPLTINEPTNLYAIAVLDNYRPSVVLKRNYKTTALKVLESNISENGNDCSPDFIPTIKFSSKICKGGSFNNISLSRGTTSGSRVNGSAVIVDDQLFFVPDEKLPIGEYTFNIPEKAVLNEQYEPNIGQSFTFSSVCKNLVKSLTGAHNTNVVAGWYYFMYQNDLGELFVWGKNDFGQLGDGTLESRTLPYRVIDKVKYIATSLQVKDFGSNATPTSFALLNDGSLWGWGGNSKGQVGNGTTQNQLTPYKIMSNVSSLCANPYRTFAIKTDGSLYGWGSNPDGEIIADNTNDYYTPTYIMTNVRDVATQRWSTFTMKNDWTLWSWGQHSKYQGNLGCGTTYENKPTQIMTGVRQIAAGSRHGFAIKSDNTLWGWGHNVNGCLGLGSKEYQLTPAQVVTNVKYVTISLEGNPSYIIKSDNSLWACGSNYEGQLGNGKTTNCTTFVKILDNVSEVIHTEFNGYALKLDNTLWVWGSRDYGQMGTKDGKHLTPVKVLDNVANFSASSNRVIVIKKDGSVWAWGEGDSWTPKRIFGGYTLKKEITGITLPQKEMDIHLGQTSYIHVNTVPIDADYNTISYVSSNTNVATVSERGIVQPVSVGTTDITVKVDNKYTIVCKINVIEAYKINFISNDYYKETIEENDDNDRVQFTITPEDGYKINKLVIRDDNGQTISYSQYGYTYNDNRTYSFTMPNSNVTIEVDILRKAYKVSLLTSDKGMVSSSVNESIPGETVTLTITPDDYCKLSKLTIVDNDNTPVEFTLNGNIVTFSMPTSHVSVSATFEQLGDLDVNGVIDVADMVLTINHVLGKTVQDDGMAGKMDMNGDGQVDVGDVILIIKAILAQGGQVEVPAEARGKAETVDITKYTAMQLNVTVPTGTQIADVQLAGLNSVTHQLMYLQTGDDCYTVVVYSLDNQTFGNVEGSLLEVTLDSDGEAVISNVLLATPAGERTFVGSMPMGTATGIWTVGGDVVNSNAVYDLRGNKMPDKGRLPKGLYIMNGKKVIK